jgi:hypothetical protein
MTTSVEHAQREAVRALMDRCEGLADAFDAGRGDLIRLRQAVALLRAAFNVHWTSENRFRPTGDQAIRMRSGARPTDALRDVIATLRAHLDEEPPRH